MNRNSGLHLFTSKANQNSSVRYSVSKSYYTNIEVQNVNKALVYMKKCVNVCNKSTII